MQKRNVSVCVVILFVCLQQFAAAGPKSTGIPRFDAAVDKGLAYLRVEVEKREPEGGQLILAAYAMVKCGVPKEDPIVIRAIAAAAGRSNGGTYRPISAYDHVYGAGVDSLLLSDADAERYQPNLQAIANYVQSVQQADGSWSDGPQKPGDVSMSQYGVLALWACHHAGCKVAPVALDRAADFLMRKGNADGGWAYRPGTTEGPGAGSSTHNMTMAGAGALGICRLLLHGLRSSPKPNQKDELVFGALRKVDPLAESEMFAAAFQDYQPQYAAGSMDSRVDRAFAWNLAHFAPVSHVEHNLYYYYCLERAAAVGDSGKIHAQDWFILYGDGLLTLQAEDGSFQTHSGPVVGTSFALLYYMRSTKQWIDGDYGFGQTVTGAGNPFGSRADSRKPTELSVLLADIMMICNFPDLDNVPVEFTYEVVRSVSSIDDLEKLVGQVEILKSLLRHSNADVRRAACWALGRTSDFKLIPLMLTALRDPSVDVNVEAICALRYIAHKPQGFGETLDPLHGLETASTDARLRIVNEWRQNAIKSWSNWYFSICPPEERGSIDHLLMALPVRSEILKDQGPFIID